MNVRIIVSAVAFFSAVVTASSALSQEDGATLFAQNCSACHQPMGQGVPGAFPALVGDKLLLSDPRNPAYVVTHGRGGMPNFSEELSDTQIAAILSYVRSAWGNTAPPLDASVVASIRGAPAPPDNQAGLPFH
jgi:mono/diheme cytochrome c family protein